MESKNEPLGVLQPKARTISDVTIRNSKPRAKPFKIYDGSGLGLFLLVTPTGSKLWRLKYRVGGREKLLSLGVYPAVGLKEAREKAMDSKKLLGAGVDPSETKQAQKAEQQTEACTFRLVANEWITKNTAKWSSGYAIKVKARLENDVFPWLGDKSIRAITAPELLATLRRIEARRAFDMAHRAMQDCSAVYRYGIACGYAERDISADLRGAIASVKVRHYAALTSSRIEIGDFGLRA